jgi:hypothetical protein
MDLRFLTAPLSSANSPVERMRIDYSGNVGIGTSSPTNKLVVKGTHAVINVENTGLFNFNFASSATGGEIIQDSNYPILFKTNNTERMRIDSSGNLLVGTTDAAPRNFTSGFGFQAGAGLFQVGSTSGSNYFNLTSASGTIIEFRRQAGTVGNISTNGSNCTFNSTSDYRLKENIVPMSGALSVVSRLKPCTYTWKIDGSTGQGFVAHELAEVLPDCVTGGKDAVKEDGSINPQMIDTSVLVATLTAAIQELKALVDTQASTITTLTDRITALEAK